MEEEERGPKRQIESRGDVVERLMNKAKESFKKKLEMTQFQSLKQAMECTFIPETNQNDIILQNSKMGNADFMTRQNMLLERKFISTRKVEMETADRECTFKPVINPISAMIAEEVRANNLENAPDYQLYYLPLKKKAVLQAELVKQEEGKYSFKPSINSVSRMIAKSKTVNELADESTKNDKLRRMKSSIIKKELLECSFKPSINVKSRGISSKYKEINEDDLIKKAVHERQKEFEEIKDCTFKPVIHQYVKTDNIEIKGINGFLKKTQMARKLKEEQKEREMKAFRPELVRGEFGPKRKAQSQSIVESIYRF